MTPDPIHKHPLWVAVDARDHDAAKRLLDRGVDVNMVDADEQSLLHIAIYGEDLEMVELLIQHGIDVNLPTNHLTPLQVCAVIAWVEGALKLVNAGANLDGNMHGGWSSLHDAIHEQPQYIMPDPGRRLDMVRLLIRSGADVFACQPGGETLLMTAARFGNAGIVLALITAGVDPQAVDRQGDTASNYAQVHEHPHVEAIIREAIIGEDISRHIENFSF